MSLLPEPADSHNPYLVTRSVEVLIIEMLGCVRNHDGSNYERFRLEIHNAGFDVMMAFSEHGHGNRRDREDYGSPPTFVPPQQENS
jgi:hypothetical protein